LLECILDFEFVGGIALHRSTGGVTVDEKSVIHLHFCVTLSVFAGMAFMAILNY